MRYIGDIHADLNLYLSARGDSKQSIQVGDFGFGFIPEKRLENFNLDATNHRFIRGNHDDPAKAKAHVGFIPSGLENDTFFINGGWSIDRDYRVEGVSWWPEEEYSCQQLDNLVQEFTDSKPKVVVSHEAPYTVCHKFFNARYPPGPSRTSQALENMLAAHIPEVWVFGHWHLRRDQVVNGTRFICLEPGGYIDL